MMDKLLHKDLKFLSSKRYKTGHLWEVESRVTESICRRCGLVSSTRFGKLTQIVREESLRRDHLWLKIHKHRYFCKSCKKPFAEQSPGCELKCRSTVRFKKSVLLECLSSKTLSFVKSTMRISSGFVFKTHYDYLAKERRKFKSKSWPSKIGIDEHFFTRRRGFRDFSTVFVDLGRGKLFEMCLGRDFKSLKELVESIPGREKVEVVCIDFSSSYRSIVERLFPNAQIVADRFHAQRLITGALLKERASVSGARKDLRVRRKLLMNSRKLSVNERVDIKIYLKNHDKLRHLYEAKESIARIYRNRGFKRAYLSLIRTYERIKDSKYKELRTLAKTLWKWSQQIINWFKFKVTNGITEAINGQAKRLQSRACGYRNFDNYRLALLNACGY